MFIPWWVIILGLFAIGMIANHFEKRIDDLESRVTELEGGLDDDVDNLYDDELVKEE